MWNRKLIEKNHIFSYIPANVLFVTAVRPENMFDKHLTVFLKAYLWDVYYHVYRRCVHVEPLSPL